MKRVAFLFVILLLCAFTKEIEEMDIYYEGEKRQKRRKAGICHCPGAERHGKAGSGSFEKSRRKSIYFIGAGH